MSLSVYQVENLFWYPGSYRQPNSLPKNFKDEKVFNVNPQIYDLNTGSVTLEGDNGNGCEYKGIFYILTRGTPLDIEKKRYVYHMVRDVGCNTVLKGRVIIKGDIATFNDDKTIEKYLHTTSIVIDNPAEIARIEFEEKRNLDGKNKLNYLKDDEHSTIKPITADLGVSVLTEYHKEGIKSKIKLIKNYKEFAKVLYQSRNDIYILGTFIPSKLKHNGKRTVKDAVNEALTTLLTDPNRIVAKVSPSAQLSNKLTGHYCITLNDQSIGTPDQTVEIRNIDLSGLTDIRRISPTNLKPPIPDNALTEENGFMITESNKFDITKANTVYKLCRKAYLPFSKNLTFTGKATYKIPIGCWTNDINPQLVKFKIDEYSEEQTASLYGIDKQDFQLSGYLGSSGKSPRWYNYFTAIGLMLVGAVATVATAGTAGAAAGIYGGVGASTGVYNLFVGTDFGDGHYEPIPSSVYGQTLHRQHTKLYQRYQQLIRDGSGGDKYLFVKHSFIPHIPLYGGDDRQNLLLNKFGRKTPPYGLLMGQTDKRYGDGERCVYIGQKTLNELNYYCGIKRSTFLEKYSATDKGGSNLDNELQYLCIDPLFTKWYLDFGELTFLNFMPTRRKEEAFEKEQHKCDNDDIYGIHKYLAPSIENKYEVTRLLHEARFITPNGEITEPNPGRPERFAGGWAQREETKEKILLKAPFELKLPLEKGDFFISNQEYEGRRYNDDPGAETQEGGEKHVLSDDGSTVTLNVLEDFIQGSNKGEVITTPIEDNDPLFENFDTKLFICTDLDGNIGVRSGYELVVKHQLAKDDDQLINSVDGAESATIKYWHLKGHSLPMGEEDAIEGETMRKLLGLFYKQIGINVEVRQGGTYGDGLTPKQIKENPQGYLFDLVGTDGYAFVREGKAHLILKKDSKEIVGPLKKEAGAFKKPPKETEEDKKSDFQKLSELTLTQKINQICTFHHKSYKLPLRSKFKFTYEPDPLEPQFVVDGIDTKSKLKINDYHLLTFKNAIDHIEEPISFHHIHPEQEGKIGDELNLISATIERNRADEDATYKRTRLGLNRQLIDITAQRAEGDLGMKAYEQKGALAKSSLALIGATGRGGSSALANAIKSATTIKRSHQHLAILDEPYDIASSLGSGYTELFEEGNFGDPYAASLYDVDVLRGESKIPGIDLRKQFKKGRAVERFLGLGGKGGLMNPISGIIDATNQLNYYIPEQQRRIEEDKRIATQKGQFSQFENDRSHFRRAQDSALRIAGLVHRYNKEGMTETEIGNKGREKVGLTSDTYIEVRYPSELQLLHLEEHRKEFGVPVDIPNQTIVLTSGMSENIITFRNIDDEGVTGTIQNEGDKDGIRGKLIDGVKIVDVTFTTPKYDYFDHNLIVPSVIKDDERLLEKIEKLENELEECKKHSTTTTRGGSTNFKVLLQKLKEDIDNADNLYEDIKLVDNEIDLAKKHGDQFDEKLIELYEELRDSLLAEYHQAIKAQQNAKKLEDCEKERENLKQKLDTAEDERDKCREELNNAHNKERSLLNENQSLQSNLKNIRDELHQEKLDKLAKEEELTKKTQDLEKSKNNLEIVKRAQAAAERDLASGRERALAKETNDSKKVICWDQVDFLKAFKDMQGNYQRMYKTIVEAPFFGLDPALFVSQKGIPFLQCIAQTVEECEKMLADDYSFLPKQNKEFREGLLTKDGEDTLRGCKMQFIERGSRLKRSTVEIENPSLSLTRESKFYKRSLALWGTKEHSEDLVTGKYLGDKYLKLGSLQKGYTFGHESNLYEMLCYRDSFLSAAFGTQVRWFGTGDLDSEFSNNLNGDVAYYTHGYYDLHPRYTPGLALAWALGGIKGYNREPLLANFLSKKHAINFFNNGGGHEKRFSHQSSYQGRSDRLFYLGYVLGFIGGLCQRYNQAKKTFKEADFNTMCEGVVPADFPIMKRFLRDISLGTKTYKQDIEFKFRGAYKVWVDNKSITEAFDEVDQELIDAEAMKQ